MGWAAPVAVRNCGNHCTHRPQTHSEGGWPVGRQFGRCRPCQESVMPGSTPPDIHTVIDPQIVRQVPRAAVRRVPRAAAQRLWAPAELYVDRIPGDPSRAGARNENDAA